MDQPIYKILTAAEWDSFQALKEFKGTELDVSDGFFHLSKADQIEGVIERFFAGIKPLFVLKFTNPTFLSEIRWETSSSGNTFPHYYGEKLVLEDVVDVQKIES